MTRARKTNLFFLGLVSFYVIACTIIMPMIPRRYLSENVAIILSQLFILLPGFVYVLASRGEALNQARFKGLGFGNVLLLILFTIAMVPVISFINSLSMMFAKNYLVEELDSLNTNPLWLNLLLIAVIPALVEEVTFRGILYSGYRNSVIKYAIFASALEFGLFHMNINQFCYAAFMGIVFSLLYEATGSMFASITVHLTFNANTVLLQKILDMSERYIRKLAEENPEYSELVQRLSENETTTTFADYSLVDKLSMLSTLLVGAVIGGVIAYIILVAVARRFNRDTHLKMVIATLFGRKVAMPQTHEVHTGREYIEDNNIRYGGKIVDAVFIVAVVLCVMMML